MKGFCRGVAFGTPYELVRRGQEARLIELADELTTEELVAGVGQDDPRPVAGYDPERRADELANVYERR